jgi:2-C-methyl-D-erythritol 4-phosphate cytidylyltransferase
LIQYKGCASQPLVININRQLLTTRYYYDLHKTIFIPKYFLDTHPVIRGCVLFEISYLYISNKFSVVEKTVIVVAGGKGLRMGGEIPKQFFLLNGLPILMRTINVFTLTFPEIKVILVLPENQVEYWRSLCQDHQFTTDHQIAFGGETRFHSVKSGLSHVKDGLVGIHDAVRPLVSEQTIKVCFEKAEKTGNAAPVMPINDSIRKVDESKNQIANREAYRIIQTPQVFHTSIIKDAFSQPYDASFTDDASVVESNGIAVNLVPGNFENIKITRPSDVKMAEFLLGEVNN